MRLLIQLRWLAVLGQIITMSLVHYGMGIRLPLPEMGSVLLALVITNLLYAYCFQWQRRNVTPGGLFIALLADVAALAVQLYLSGGANNPFIYLFLLQVILGTILLRPLYTWAMVCITAMCVTGLLLHYRPLSVQLAREDGLSNLYLQGVLICFALTTVLLVVFTTQIVSNLRRRDSRLAAMRQRATEEEHIVRLGLLATGAAHELGTPLATMSVILGDWQRMSQIKSDPTLMEDLTEMQQQLLRCKEIVTGVLMSAGSNRAGALESTTLLKFMEQLVAQWRQHHAPKKFFFTHDVDDDLEILSDTALQQVICNVLDNAYEASPNEVHLHLDMTPADELRLTVLDKGPGFDPLMLERLGKPLQSSKQGRPGRGVGLFLVMNVVRSLGGTLTVSDRPAGGANVCITFPLSAITLEDSDHASATSTAAG